jgi:hypothetical protein
VDFRQGLDLGKNQNEREGLKCLSKLVSDTYQCSLQNPEGLDLEYSWNKEVIDLGSADSGDQKFWDTPRLLKADYPSVEQTPGLRTRIDTWLAANASHIDARIVTNHRKMLAGAPVAIGSVEGATSLSLFGGKPFTGVELDGLVITQEPMRMDTRHCVWFAKGVRSVATSVSGNFIAVLVPPSLVASKPDLSAYLQEAESKHLVSICPCFAFGPTEAISIPFGWQPLFFVPDAEALKKQERGKKDSAAKKEEGGGHRRQVQAPRHSGRALLR